jgi:chaperonin GroES
MKIKPLRDLLLIELDEVEEKTQSGILVQQGWEKTKHTATVLGVGNDVTHAKVGDRIIVNPYALLDSEHDEKTYQFMRERDILGRVT